MHTVMKSINRIFGSFIIVCLALVSCEKEKHPQSVDPEQPAVVVRTIKVSFDTKSTRTELVGEQPYFKDGDLIKMAQVDGEAEPQVCTVKVVDNKASVETTLEGKLKAVYPHDCAVVSNNKITGVSVSASQNGTFEEAHICMAEQASEDDESLVFHNQTPILRFYVDESIQVQSITISGISNPITVKPSSGYFTPSDLDGPDQRICYAAVPSGMNANEFTFTSTTGTQGTVVQTLKATTSLANGTMYNIFIPYYIDLGDAGKWGYCNVGAFLPEEFGKYFAWGDTVGQTWTGSKFSGGGFSTTPDVGTPIPGVLPLEYDAAAQNWGSNWRMPTVDEYMTLLDIDNLSENTGPLSITDECWTKTVETKSLVFPVAGVGEGISRWGTCDDSFVQGSYWSSSFFEDFEMPYCFTFSAEGGEIGYTYDSFLGMSVRPIYAGGDAPDTNITGDSLDPYVKDTETF